MHRKIVPLVAVAARTALAALEVDLDNSDSIIAAAKLKAYDVMTYYKGNLSGQIPGILPGPPPVGEYYWWQGGALWGTMIDYWHYTGDTTYNDEVMQALQFQTGPPQNMYMPYNWTASLGNDDQSFWGMSALLAAEVGFENPPADAPQWLALAQAVFNSQTTPIRRDDQCGGGLRWQITPLNNGYNYKNSIANGCFFNIGARLARYTRNDTYAQWAAETWDWVEGVGLIDAQYNIYDGGHTDKNCTDINRAQFSYNAAIFLQGAAFMFDYTQDPVWKTRVEGLLTNMLATFFPNGIAKEISCESDINLTCTTDMLSFKGYIHRWLAVTAQIAPYTHDRIFATLKTSAEAAVRQCTGGDTGRVCGFRWVQGGTYDGTNGAGQEMNVLGALLSMLLDKAPAPVTNLTGGTSQGNPSAGTDESILPYTGPVSQGDKAGAAFLTLLFLTGCLGTLSWMMLGWGEVN
ncbi:mannan endo-1,6-alpha-mannosidase [Sporothrix brasiliensis 5110]|uniref:Mannan endo-1,6-alpha-mannosidase n=1 Tax=Sporothrix brasiliensis 5110 TaxID=1398154 RepID=A0A0C2EMS9_9PEZI|nr:mannan endo-1,6-alpha-mannosidase [Sporothrix brasiliensis 5110]KIH87419.1 mannan endo-1,6-alpha-mannosidase [Sporothrix brasiliensis 5110]